MCLGCGNFLLVEVGPLSSHGPTGIWDSCVQDVGAGPSASGASCWSLTKSIVVPQSPTAPPSSHAWGEGPETGAGKLVGRHL